MSISSWSYISLCYSLKISYIICLRVERFWVVTLRMRASSGYVFSWRLLKKMIKLRYNYIVFKVILWVESVAECLKILSSCFGWKVLSVEKRYQYSLSTLDGNARGKIWKLSVISVQELNVDVLFPPIVCALIYDQISLIRFLSVTAFISAAFIWYHDNYIKNLFFYNYC